MVSDATKLASLLTFAIVCACGAPELTYRSDSPSVDGGADADSAVSDANGKDTSDATVEEDGAIDASDDGPHDAPPDTPDDVPQDTPTDAPDDVPQDTPTDTPVDALGDCPAGMVPAPRGNGTSYCIDATEVTQQAYAAWLSTAPDPSTQSATCALNAAFAPDLGACVGGSYSPATTPGLPVTCVDWCDAFAYCDERGQRLCGAIVGGATKYNKYADAAESQWMRACSAEGSRPYPYDGNYQPTSCNGADFGEGAPVNAGSTVCIGGVSGLFDMSGNVGEWEDCCSGAAPISACRVRGGSFLDTSGAMRCDAAAELSREQRSASVGFRCCGE